MYLHHHVRYNVGSNIFVMLVIYFLTQTKDIVCFVEAGEDDNSYDLDCSFPIHSPENTKECSSQHKNRFETDPFTHYSEHLKECRYFYEDLRTFYQNQNHGVQCDNYELDRLTMNARQPQSMVNYTNPGFKLIRAPENVMNLVNSHWERFEAPSLTENEAQQQWPMGNIMHVVKSYWDKDYKLPKIEEVWPAGNHYVNHWKAPTYMDSVDDSRIGTVFERDEFKDKIWDGTREILEEWANAELVPSSMYGIRIYTEGAILIPHVDRLPLVLSAMINVAQDVDEPWPLEVYDRQGKAWNITMEPGDMLLFEPGSVIHGRPFPLKGRYHANLFIHFEPTGRLPIKEDLGKEWGLEVPHRLIVDSHYTFPPYLLPDSPELENWNLYNPNGWVHERGKLRKRRKDRPDNFCFIQY